MVSRYEPGRVNEAGAGLGDPSLREAAEVALALAADVERGLVPEAWGGDTIVVP